MARMYLIRGQQTMLHGPHLVLGNCLLLCSPRAKNSFYSSKSWERKARRTCTRDCFHNWLSILCIESKMQKISAYKYYNVLCFMRFCNLIFLVILGFQPSVKLGIIEIKKSKMSWFDNKLRPTFRSILLIHYAKCVFYCLFN